MISIRRDLTIALLGAISLAVLLGGAAIYHETREEVDELLDYHLRQFALSLRDQAFRQMFSPPEDDDEQFDFVIQVWGPDGVSLYYSHPHQHLPVVTQLGYSTIDTREGTWRVYATRTRTQLIQVAQPMKVRNAMALAGVTRVLTPMLLLLPLLSLLIWAMVGRGLAPLKRLAGAVARRTPTSLEPLPVQDTPEEVRPLIASLNDLLQRLDEALATQRALVADAAHELRTPLAALQLQAQLLQRAQTEAERNSALEDLLAGVRRSTHLVGQLLTLARQDPDIAGRPLARVGLADLARTAVTELEPLADDRDIDLGLTRVDERVSVLGDWDALLILLRNLIDNALRYTPRGGSVDVSVTTARNLPCLEVADTGPGIPEQDRLRVFDRFYRGAGTGEAGTGLGLSIVKAIADRHQAHIELGTSEAGGLRVRVMFPAQGSGVTPTHAT